MIISPDQMIFWHTEFEIAGFKIPFDLSLTLVGTWVLMVLLVLGAKLSTKGIVAAGKKKGTRNRWHLFIEALVSGIRSQIVELGGEKAASFVPLIGTLFLFILISNLTTVIPIVLYVPNHEVWDLYLAPTGSLSTTSALALMVMISVFFFGIKASGFKFFKPFFEPPFMFPFHVISEASRGVTLAVRLFGNIMSGAVIIAILILFVPFLFPIVFHLFGLFIGVLQAYIFAVLSLVYIAQGMEHAHEEHAH